MKADGTVERISPKNGEEFVLKEVYELLQCSLVEVVYLGGGYIMIIDEEGKFSGKAVNEKATRKAIAANAIFPGDYIVGDAVFCESSLFD